MNHITIINTSLNPESKSQLLGSLFAQHLAKQSISYESIDLREKPLPFAGTLESWDAPNAIEIAEAIERASHVVFCTPIYCYDTNAAAKNVIELVGRKLSDKVVSFICAAGGANSYMSILGLANHIMLDFRAVIVPRFFYCTPNDWLEDSDILKPEMQERLKKLFVDMKRISVSSD